MIRCSEMRLTRPVAHRLVGDSADIAMRHDRDCTFHLELSKMPRSHEDRFNDGSHLCLGLTNSDPR